MPVEKPKPLIYLFKKEIGISQGKRLGSLKGKEASLSREKRKEIPNSFLFLSP